MADSPALRRSLACSHPLANSPPAARTAKVYESQAGTKASWAKFTRPESNGRLIEPLVPST
jgi:hypothetical protein